MSESHAVLIEELAHTRDELRQAERRIVELAEDNERLRQELVAARGNQLVAEVHAHRSSAVVERLRFLGVSMN